MKTGSDYDILASQNKINPIIRYSEISRKCARTRISNAVIIAEGINQSIKIKFIDSYVIPNSLAYSKIADKHDEQPLTDRGESYHHR